jgi:hypothetical protein
MADDQVTTPEPAPAPEPAKKKPKKPRRPMKVIVREWTVRLYTFALFAVVAGICAMALVYLFKSVFTPAKLPDSLAVWQGSIDAKALRDPHVPGVTDGAGRAPISHYHKVERWFQADSHNGCTVAGCHEPLPHQKSKVASFANMHVTFMDCKMCHEPASANVPAHWIGMASDRPQDAPASLRLIKMLEANHINKETAATLHPQILGLLKEVLAQLGRNEILDDLRVQIDSSQPGSPVWMKSVARIKGEVALHARGEYGAKLARKSPAGDVKKMVELTKQFFAQPARHTEIEKEIHKPVLAKPNACQTCHAKQDGMLDFEKLGYSPRRAAGLRELPMASLMEQIRRGETFQLPKLIEVQDGK